MKIAMMTNNYKPFLGGVPISIERLTESLRKLGHEVVVFAPTYRNMTVEEGTVRYRSLVKSICKGAAVPNGLDRAIEKKFRDGNFDIIHVHHPMVIGWTALYLSQKYRVPLVFTYHTRYEQYLHYVGLSGIKNILPAYMKAFCAKCDQVIAPTPGMKTYLEEIGVHTPVSILPTGILNEGFFPESRQVSKLRTQLLGEKKYLFCTVARLAKEKNIGFLLQSLAIFKEKQKFDFRLALIGEGPERERLEKLAFRLGLCENVVFVGKVPNSEIKNYCAAADLFLFASTSETQGIVSLESMAAKTPVLAVDATGTRDIVKNGVNGYLTEEIPEKFAEKLVWILQQDTVLADNLRDGAWHTAALYSEEATAIRAVSCYEKAVQNRREKNEVRLPARHIAV